MTERARHLVERVFPDGVRVRQWVLSLPFDLRWRAAFEYAPASRLAGLAAQRAATEDEQRLGESLRQEIPLGHRPLIGRAQELANHVVLSDNYFSPPTTTRSPHPNGRA